MRLAAHHSAASLIALAALLTTRIGSGPLTVC